MITSYRPLQVALPLSLAHLSYGMPQEIQHQDSFQGEDLFQDEVRDKGQPDASAPVEKKGNLASRALEMANVKAKQAVNSINTRDFERLNNVSRNGHRNKARMTAEEVRAAEETLEDDAFTHPAAKEPQRVIWLPEDELGLATAEIRDNEAIGIASTSSDAFLNAKVCMPQMIRLALALTLPLRVMWRSQGRRQTNSRSRHRREDHDDKLLRLLSRYRV